MFFFTSIRLLDVDLYIFDLYLVFMTWFWKVKKKKKMILAIDIVNIH